MTDLRKLQQRFQDYLVDGSEAIEQDIVSTRDALAEHRLGTYYNAYRIRLIDALAVDYSALDKYLGREAFERIALDYLHRYPSSNPSLRWFGRHLPVYLRDHYAGGERELICELAEYEWVQANVFDAANETSTVQLEDMAGFPPESWPELHFSFIPALRWLDLSWNVPLIEAALDQGGEVPSPEKSEFPLRWLLWRRDYKTYWRSLDVHEAWAIETAANGGSFGAICEGLLEWIDAEQVALIAAGFLKQWIADQMLAKLHG